MGFCDAVATGLAPDGGLLVPERLPDLSADIASWENLGYAAICSAFFRHFATDLPPDTLVQMVEKSYAKFNDPLIAPLRQLDERLFVLELFHGPTLAFKDFALQLLGNLYAEQIRRTGIPIRVLGATSGDTGAAAIHGLLGQPGVQIFILYPDGKVSPLQERQMACTGADNVFAIAIEGSFDDAQTAIKDVFGDLDFRRAHHLSAVNSINLARILAQCVYYAYAWLQLPKPLRNEVHFIVPTGNFGNVLAGWLMHRMGLAVQGFRVATNRNDILYRLFNSGEYSTGAVTPSCAPSMDIQIASNFERFLYFHEGEDPAKVRNIMQSFRATGTHVFNRFERDVFSASRADDVDISRNIARIYRQYGYIADPHTACGFQDLPEEGVRIVLATAHPAKFPDTIVNAIGVHPKHPTLDALATLPLKRSHLQPTPKAIKAFIAQA